VTPETQAAIARLTTMTVAQLRDQYVATFGEPTASRHKTWLVRRIAWRLQANDEGGLSERALKRAAELANDAEFRVTAPRPSAVIADPARTKHLTLPAQRDAGLAPGTVLRRTWRDRDVVVTVLPAGFDFGGEMYRSLSAVARAITGTQWNGHVFFGLKKPGAT
jgi:Protein of unknown function (DUF2924)